jgi:hypothetical protein
MPSQKPTFVSALFFGAPNIGGHLRVQVPPRVGFELQKPIKKLHKRRSEVVCRR